MSDDKLNQLLTTLPDEDEIVFRATRARHRALARLDEPRTATRSWSWVPGLAAAALALIVAGIVFRGGAPSPSNQVSVQSAPVQSRRGDLRMKWVLSDGTRVLWTFHKELN